MTERSLSLPQQQQILDVATITGDFTFASGLRSTEKFEFDNIPDDSLEFELSVNGLLYVIKYNFSDADAIITVANGAVRLGDPLVDALGIVHIPTTRDDSASRRFSLVQSLSPDIQTAVIVDDVYTRGTNAAKVAALLAGTSVNVLGAAVICDRSGFDNPTFRAGEQDLPVYSAIKHHIPTNNERGGSI